MLGIGKLHDDSQVPCNQPVAHLCMICDVEITKTSILRIIISHINICSIHNKVQDIRSIVSRHGIDTLAVSETWLGTSYSNSLLHIPNYRVYRQDRISSRGSGICFYVRDNLQANIIAHTFDIKILGPTLFVLYTRDICRILPTTVCHQEFADAIVIDISDENPTTVCNALTAAVTSLANWLHEIGLLLNSQKTQLLFMKPRTSPDFNPKVYCGADLLTVTASANYLGVVVDSDLSWDYHIAHIGRKTARTIGQLWCHGRALSLRARRTWLLSMIVSQICYGSNSFFPGLSVRLFDRVEK